MLGPQFVAYHCATNIRDFILPDQLHSSPTRKRKDTSSQETSDVESQLLPKAKAKPASRTKRVKVTKFDDVSDRVLGGSELGGRPQLDVGVASDGEPAVRAREGGKAHAGRTDRHSPAE
jgi:hypothetical protein